MPPTRIYEDIVKGAVLYVYCRTHAHAVGALNSPNCILYSEVKELKKIN